MEFGSLETLTVFDHLLDGIVAVDKDFQVIYANEAFAGLCGMSLRKLKRRANLGDCIKLLDDFFNRPNLKYDESLSQMYREIEFQADDGRGGSVQYIVQELKVDQSPRWVIFFRDVTLEKSLHDKYKDQLQAKEQVIEDLEAAQVKLKQYSEGLEVMVQERTEKLRKALDFQKATLNCLGQGFFVFGPDGKVLPDYSRICPEMFGTEPAGTHVSDLLQLRGDSRETFSSFLKTAFLDAIPFDDLLDLLDLGHLEILGRTLKADFYPMRTDEGLLTGIVVVATDISQELRYEKQLEEQKLHAQRITQILRHPKQYLSFVKESSAMFDKMAAISSLEELESTQEELNRNLHTIKGGASSFYLGGLAQAVHDTEDRVGHFLSRPLGAWLDEVERLRRSLKLSRKEVDELLGIERRAAANLVEVPQDVLTRWCQELGNPSKTARVSSEIFSSYLCDPISEALGHLKGETQKVAALLNKEVNPLLVEGDDIRVPLNFYSGVFNNLVHCLRNSVDHGVEPGDEREELGKPRKATLGIHISSAQVSRTRSELIIEIYDDGRGLNEAKLRTKLGPQASREEVMMSIFEDGFSTKEEVTTVSGRGVGMSALRAEVQKLGGKVEVESRPGQGLKIILRLPKISSLSDYVGHLMFRSKAS